MTSNTRSKRRQIGTVLGAAAAALAAWVVADPVLGIEIAVTDDSTGVVRRVGPVAVAVAGLVAGLAGWGLLAALQRFVERARDAWTAIAVGVFVVSLLGPTAAATPAAMVVLLAMHTVVAGVLLWGLRRSRDGRPRNPFAAG